MPVPDKRRSGHRWIFTAWPEQEDCDDLFARLSANEGVEFIAMNEVPEVCPDTGRAHHHGMVIFTQRKRMPTLKRFSATAHWEQMRGTPEQAYNYLSKEGSAVEAGIRPKTWASGGAGEADRWKVARESATVGNWEAVPDQLMVQYFGNLSRLNMSFGPTPPELEDVCGEWHYGVPNSGKTFNAYVSRYPNCYRKVLSKFWCGYTNQDVVVIDDVSKVTQNLASVVNWFKVWPDRYAFRGEIKMSSVMMRPKLVIVTSNHSIDDVFQLCPQADIDAIKRRFKRIVKYIAPFDGLLHCEEEGTHRGPIQIGPRQAAPPPSPATQPGSPPSPPPRFAATPSPFGTPPRLQRQNAFRAFDLSASRPGTPFYEDEGSPESEGEGESLGSRDTLPLDGIEEEEDEYLGTQESFND